MQVQSRLSKNKKTLLLGIPKMEKQKVLHWRKNWDQTQKSKHFTGRLKSQNSDFSLRDRGDLGTREYRILRHRKLFV